MLNAEICKLSMSSGGNKDDSGSKTTNQQQTETLTVWTYFHDCMCIICVDHDMWHDTLQQLSSTDGYVDMQARSCSLIRDSLDRTCISVLMDPLNVSFQHELMYIVHELMYIIVHTISDKS